MIGLFNAFRRLAAADLNSKNKDNKKPALKINYLTAYCKRLANRTHVIGNTVFKFDKNGKTEVADLGNNRLNYEHLLKMNGVTPEGKR